MNKDKELYTEIERAEIIVRHNKSMAKDFDGSRRKYADSVSTSEVLQNRRLAYLAINNGHTSKS